MDKHNLQKALRITATLLESQDLTQDTRDKLIQIENELEEYKEQGITDEKFKELLKRLFDIALIVLPFIIEIIKKWI